MKPDFTGYATKYNVKCTDGRTIRNNAFADCDGKRVPLVWGHQHTSPDNVVGHGDLYHRDDGVYIEGYFNKTKYGKQAKGIVDNGDVNCLSICANHIVERDYQVMHGNIKEVSLVLSGANPEAIIDNIVIEHSDGSFETNLEEAIIISTPEMSEINVIEHEDDSKNENNIDASTEQNIDASKEQNDTDKSDKTVGDIFETLNEKQKKVAYFMINAASKGTDIGEMVNSAKNIEHADDSEETVGDIWNTFSEEQKKVVIFLMKKAQEDGKSSKNTDTKNADNKSINHSDESEETNMNYNAFEANETNEQTLCHEDISEMIETAKNEKTSLKESMLMHADEDYGITNIGYLFPDAELVSKKIELLRNNPTDWVAKVMAGVHKSPFSRIKMMYSDLTPENARARGYVKGNKKLSEVVALFKRTINPTTIYKLQKLDRDDIIDVTTIDVVAWIKAEMRIQVEEEVARAILVGDQRDPLDTTNKINEQCIIPILKDYASDIYAIRHPYELGESDDEYSRFVDETVLSMVDYEGSGSPTLFVDPAYLARCLLIKDALGNRLYKTRAELASAMGVKEIVEVPYMKNRTYTDADDQTQNTMIIPTGVGQNTMLVRGIVVNLNDYTYGADKGGALNLFDDFDIDFNQYKYLLETRASGALTKPHSALLIGEIQ